MKRLFLAFLTVTLTLSFSITDANAQIIDEAPLDGLYEDEKGTEFPPFFQAYSCEAKRRKGKGGP